jgi:hypothetical protein
MSFGFGPEFATAKEDCRTGFERTMRGVSFAEGFDTEKLYTAFETGHRQGNPRLTRQLMAAAIGETAWRWPWMEECATQFDELNMWPSDWAWRKIARPIQWVTIPRETKIEMLEINLSKCAFAARDFRKSYTNPDILAAFRYTLKATPPCELEAFIVEQKRAAIEAHDFTDMPPYFPGDRSWITILKRAP